MSRVRRWAAAAALVLLAAGAAACGSTSLAAPERGVVRVDAQNYRFDPDTIHFKAGRPVRLVLQNHDPVKHNISFKGLEPQVLVVTPFKGEQAIVFTPSRPGTYYMYCSEPGHEQLGMHGTAIVE